MTTPPLSNGSEGDARPLPGTDLEVATHPLVAQVLLEHLGADEVADVVASLSPATWRAYRPAWTRWRSWAEDNGHPLLPPSAAATAAWVGWLTDDQALALPSVRKHVAALATLVDLAAAFGVLPADTLRPTEYPRVRRRLNGKARTARHRPAQKHALSTDEIIAITTGLAEGGRAHQCRRRRDTAIVLLAFAGAFRRSELSALDVADVTFRQDGYLEIVIRHAKRDQEGHGRTVGIAPGAHQATCPVRALRRWLDTSGIDHGPLFRPIVARAGGMREFVQDTPLGARSIAQAIKDAAATAGIDPDSIGGHSTRRGHITTAVTAGATDGQIAATTGQSRATIDGYTAARQVTTNSSRLLGL